MTPSTLGLVRVLSWSSWHHTAPKVQSNKFIPDISDEFCVLREVLLDSDQLSSTRVFLGPENEFLSDLQPWAAYGLLSDLLRNSWFHGSGD